METPIMTIILKRDDGNNERMPNPTNKHIVKCKKQRPKTFVKKALKFICNSFLQYNIMYIEQHVTDMIIATTQ